MTNTTDTHFLATISNPRQIHDHPANNSKTKALYSFPKADRFPDSTFKSPCNVVFYEYNNNLYKDNRAYSIGGIRDGNLMVLNRDVPAPDAYDVKYYNLSAQTKKGFSFGKPDQKNSDRALTEKKNVPGPGAYTLNRNPPSRNFTFRIRTKRVKDENVDVGPGQYNITNTLDPAAKHLESKYKSVPNVRLVPPSQNKSKLPVIKNDVGFYDMKYQMNGSGNYFVSNFRNSQCRTFSKSTRAFIKVMGDAPGPGEYRTPSDFGYYESSVAAKKDK